MTSLSYSFENIKKIALKKEKISGFTLLELLISMLVASLVVSGLLYLVVELLQIDRREATLTQTQQDMQRALDYIADDVREAVFIYTDPTAVIGPGQVTDLSPGSTPILAFWRPIPQDVPANICDPWAPGSAGADAAKYDQCQVLEIRQASYSLIIYAQKRRSPSDTVWKGASRIIRYELDKYAGPLTNLTITPGYRDPATPGVGFTWAPPVPPASILNTAGTNIVLVDFVDEPQSVVSGSVNPCTSAGLNAANYTVVPNGLREEQNPSFFGCVRNPATGAVADSNSSQDAYLFLRGNAVDGAQGSVNSFSEASSLPTLKTRVLMRGIVNKNPS